MINSSLAINYKVNEIKSEAYPGEWLEYNITLINNESINQQVYINSFIMSETFKDEVLINPSININVKARNNETITIRARVNEEVKNGLYQVPIIFSYNNITERLFLKSLILNSELNPIKITNLTIIKPEKIKPLTRTNITLIIISNTNFNPKLLIALSSNDEIISECESIITLNSGINIIKKELVVPKTMPGEYSLLTTIELNNELLKQSITNVTITPYKSLITNQTITESLLGKKVIKRVINDGTITTSTIINHTINPLEEPLISNIKLSIINNNKVINEYELIISNHAVNSNITLNPGEEAVLTIKSDYSVLILTPLLIISAVIMWLYLNKKVIIRKEIIECRKDKNELIIKVGIKVKNVSMRKVKNVRVIDDLPSYARKAGGFGSLIGEINQEKGAVIFNAGTLNPKEELLLSYKFKTDVELIGRISLPPAIIKYVVNNKTLISRSNTPLIHLIKGGQ